MYPIETEVSSHGTFVGCLYYDTDPLNPMEEFDNLCTDIVYNKSSRYILGTRAVDPDEFRLPKGAIALPVYACIHSGVSLSTGSFADSWDSGMSGYIYVTREKVLKEYGVKRISARLRKIVEKCLRAELETFSRFLEGDVYGYVIYKVPADMSVEDYTPYLDDKYDSCWGFFGREFALEQMKDVMEHADRELQKELDSALDAENADCM